MRVSVPLGLLVGSVCCACSDRSDSRPAPGGGEAGVEIPGADVSLPAPEADTAASDADAAAVPLPQPHWPTCRAGCTSPPCAPPFGTCAEDYPSPPGVAGPTGSNPTCVHVTQFTVDEFEVLCEPVDGETYAGDPLEPPVNCALHAGVSDAAIGDAESIEQCTVNYPTCMPPRFGAPGWLCCNVSLSFVDGAAVESSYECISPDGRVLPVWYPPPLFEVSGNDAGEM